MSSYVDTSKPVPVIVNESKLKPSLSLLFHCGILLDKIMLSFIH